MENFQSKIEYLNFKRDDDRRKKIQEELRIKEKK